MFDSKKFIATKNKDVVTVTYDEADAYKKSTDIPFKTLKEVSDFNKRYIDEATKAAKEYAEKKLKDDKSVGKVVVTYPFSTSARGSINVSIDRCKTYRNIDTGEPIRKSAITVRVEDPYMKATKSHIKEMEAELTKAMHIK